MKATERKPTLPYDLDHSCWLAKRSYAPPDPEKKNEYRPAGFALVGEETCPACAYIRGCQDTEKKLADKREMPLRC